MRKLCVMLGLIFATFQLQAQTKIGSAEIEKVKNKKNIQLLDVRTSKEFQDGHIQNAKNLDWNNKEEFKKAVSKLDKSKPVYVYCLGGGRSKQASAYLADMGFQVYDYSGGMMDWRSSNKAEIKENKDGSTKDSKSGKGLTEEQFNHLVNSQDVVLVNYSAVWCGPCQELKPTILKIQNREAKKVKVVRLDADENKNLIKQKKISEIPKLSLYKNGKEVWSHTGIISEAELMKQINKAANKKS
ncbi:thioredoxin domain-containing protein [Sphingobacterium sp. CZ-2]|uniref:thioredoxin domain-containing protein n=1 Tax=Sphingobacterium sp. CZ-2 TaxID=2557994 RepID=UPI00106F88FB|nr:thioredoxin domain-containing protein [Sphingobacterium sp. CZ-2]QBR13068.1 thioredoxin [Sphingobacterium sp. CZ-2]